jgi:transcriptional regulator with XRE-family HTH domain
VTPERAFGEVLRELRHARQLSQESFAEACGISRPHVSRLETGRNSPLYALPDRAGPSRAAR